MESLFRRLYVSMLRAQLVLRGSPFQCYVSVRKSNLVQADLSCPNLSGYHLRGANLHEASLVRANLIGADLTNAILEGADLSGAALRGVDLSGARLTGATVTFAQLAEAASLEGAAMPSGRPYQADLSRKALSLEGRGPGGMVRAG